MKLVSQEIHTYCQQHSHEPSSELQALADVTRANFKHANMMVGALEGNFLRLLIRLSQARRILEIGTFTGYSALSMAEVLPEGGELITCDISAESTATARKHWEQSAHGDKIQLRLGPALETLESLEGPFDLVFIDADKTNYLNYWEAALPKVRVGGLVVVDNVLWSGRVLDPETNVDQAIVDCNLRIASDDRVEALMLPVRDGIFMAWKRP